MSYYQLRKDMDDKQIRKAVKEFKNIRVLIGIVYGCIIVFVFFKLSDKNMSILLALITIISPVIGYIISAFINETFHFLLRDMFHQFIYTFTEYVQLF